MDKPEDWTEEDDLIVECLKVNKKDREDYVKRFLEGIEIWRALRSGNFKYCGPERLF